MYQERNPKVERVSMYTRVDKPVADFVTVLAAQHSMTVSNFCNKFFPTKFKKEYEDFMRTYKKRKGPIRPKAGVPRTKTTKKTTKKVKTILRKKK